MGFFSKTDDGEDEEEEGDERTPFRVLRREEASKRVADWVVSTQFASASLADDDDEYENLEDDIQEDQGREYENFCIFYCGRCKAVRMENNIITFFALVFLEKLGRYVGMHDLISISLFLRYYRCVFCPFRHSGAPISVASHYPR